MKRWWLIVPLLSGCVAARPATEDQRYYFGSAECIAHDAERGLRAVADFRREAAAAAG